ncbi:MAG: HlyD family efflux transporter periplasmic adaptor subunit [Tissierellales bacterium]|nr:HlyD family efflux transporter periplasmic adaptor subunit [Tissierellales bacterium]MBN2827858.1 HlyD family efflux transporter periplasmic adaptor subunit [Tissierellales bacterium]
MANKKNKKKTRVIVAVILVIILIVAFFVYQKIDEIRKTQQESAQMALKEYTVEYGSINKTITGSGSIQPSDTRIVLSEKEGVIDQIFVEEGQWVSVDEVLSLFEVESDDESEQLKIDTAQYNLEKAQKNLNDLYQIQEDLKIYATESGTLKKYVEEGDDVGKNFKMFDLVEVNVLRIESFFSKSQIDLISTGDEAEVFLSDYLLTLFGQVTSVDFTPVALGGGTVGYKVTVDIEYNGALVEGTSAKVTVINSQGRMLSPFTGLSAKNNVTTLYSEYEATVKSINYNNGDYVDKGSLIAVLQSDDLIYDIEQQELQVQSKRLDLENLNDDDFSVATPIDGTVLTVLVDEKSYVDKGTQLFKIANLDTMEVKINIDELDIMDIKKGQQVSILSDAFEDQKFSGKVKSVSLSGVNQNGVTTYEVTISIEDRKDLMSGMNVDVEIMVANKENALIVPIGAVSKVAGKYVVTTKDEEGNPVLSSIKAGIVTDHIVEVLEGLKQGDAVYYTEVQSSTASNENGMVFPMTAQPVPGTGQGKGRIPTDGGGN